MGLLGLIVIVITIGTMVAYLIWETYNRSSIERRIRERLEAEEEGDDGK